MWVGAVVVVPTLFNKTNRTTMIMFLIMMIKIVIFLTMMIMVSTDVAAPSLLKRMNIVYSQGHKGQDCYSTDHYGMHNIKKSK